MTNRKSSVDNYMSQEPMRKSSLIAAEKDVGVSSGFTVVNTGDETFRRMSLRVPNLGELTNDAKNAADNERTMSFRTAVRMYPKAIFFSFGLSLAVIMEGYDTWLLGSFWSLPAFAQKFGSPAGIKDGVQTYQVSANWQTGLGVGSELSLLRLQRKAFTQHQVR